MVKVVLWSSGGRAHLTKPGWSKPHTHSNPTNLVLFRHKIALYRFNPGGSYYCRGLKWEQGGWAPRRPPHFNHWWGGQQAEPLNAVWRRKEPTKPNRCPSPPPGKLIGSASTSGTPSGKIVVGIVQSTPVHLVATPLLTTCLMRTRFSSAQTVRPKTAPQIYGPHILKSFFSVCGHFPASPSTVTVQCKNMKQCQNRIANSPVEIYAFLTYLVLKSGMWRRGDHVTHTSIDQRAGSISS